MPPCEPPYNVVLSQPLGQRKNTFLITFKRTLMTPPRFEIHLEFKNEKFYPGYEVVDGFIHQHFKTKISWRTKRPPKGTYVRVSMRTICTDCKYSTWAFSNELGPY